MNIITQNFSSKKISIILLSIVLLSLVSYLTYKAYIDTNSKKELDIECKLQKNTNNDFIYDAVFDGVNKLLLFDNSNKFEILLNDTGYSIANQANSDYFGQNYFDNTKSIIACRENIYYLDNENIMLLLSGKDTLVGSYIDSYKLNKDSSYIAIETIQDEIIIIDIQSNKIIARLGNTLSSNHYDFDNDSNLLIGYSEKIVRYNINDKSYQDIVLPEDIANNYFSFDISNESNLISFAMRDKITTYKLDTMILLNELKTKYTPSFLKIVSKNQLIYKDIDTSSKYYLLNLDTGENTLISKGEEIVFNSQMDKVAILEPVAVGNMTNVNVYNIKEEKLIAVIYSIDLK